MSAHRGRGDHRRPLWRSDLHVVPDVGAVARDEALLSALAQGRTDLSPDERIVALLVALRTDVSGPRELPELVPVQDRHDDSAAANNAANNVVPLPPRQRLVRLVPRGVAAAAVTAVVLSFGGVAAAGIASGPSSPLWPVHEVLGGVATGVLWGTDKSDRAHEAAQATQRLLDQAQRALDQLKSGDAASALAHADKPLRAVDKSHGSQRLQDRRDKLQVQLLAELSADAAAGLASALPAPLGPTVAVAPAAPAPLTAPASPATTLSPSPDDSAASSPTSSPSASPSDTSSSTPSSSPSASPSDTPSSTPSHSPAPSPSDTPSATPVGSPSAEKSASAASSSAASSSAASFGATTAPDEATGQAALRAPVLAVRTLRVAHPASVGAVASSRVQDRAENRVWKR